MTEQTEQAEQVEQPFLDLTADIVSAFVSNNAVHAGDLPELIKTVHASLQGLSTPKIEPVATLAPAVSIKKSVTDDYLICLEDGKKFKSLRRHLQAAYGMTPDDYRAKWNLPRDYPMVAPGYASKRSELAKASGLGTARKQQAAEPAPEPAPQKAPANDVASTAKDAEVPVKRRGRPSKKAA